MRGITPLSAHERSALFRILASSTRGRPNLHPRQRAALDAYAEILASPPFAEGEVLNAARAVIRVWSEVREHASSARPRPALTAKKKLIPAVLLDLEETPPFIDLTHDLMSSSMIERATEVVMARSPLYDLAADRPTEIVGFRPLITGAG
jgi:hypothetical protein